MSWPEMARLLPLVSAVQLLNSSSIAPDSLRIAMISGLATGASTATTTDAPPLTPPPMAITTSTPRTRLSAGRAVALYAVYVLAFVVGGGVGAGFPALVFQIIAEVDATRPDYFNLYAVMFGVTGYIAYRLAQRVAEG